MIFLWFDITVAGGVGGVGVFGIQTSASYRELTGCVSENKMSDPRMISLPFGYLVQKAEKSPETMPVAAN